MCQQVEGRTCSVEIPAEMLRPTGFRHFASESIPSFHVFGQVSLIGSTYYATIMRITGLTKHFLIPRPVKWISPGETFGRANRTDLNGAFVTGIRRSGSGSCGLTAGGAVSLWHEDGSLGRMKFADGARKVSLVQHQVERDPLVDGRNRALSQVGDAVHGRVVVCSRRVHGHGQRTVPSLDQWDDVVQERHVSVSRVRYRLVTSVQKEINWSTS